MCHLVLFILAPTVTHPNADQGLHYCQKHSRHCSRAANIVRALSIPSTGCPNNAGKRTKTKETRNSFLMNNIQIFG